MGRVVALLDDLFFQMKVVETAKRLGVEVQVATTADALAGLVAAAPNLLLVDLNARSGAIEAIRRVRGLGCRVRMVGFLSHLQKDLAAEAQQAGCDEVLPRSVFTANLGDILGTAKD